MPYVAGDVVFVVDVERAARRRLARDGRSFWTVQLPGAKTWSGPVRPAATVGQVSSKGALVAVDAATGKITGQQDIGYPVFVPPVVAGGRMYILTDNAKLIALN